MQLWSLVGIAGVVLSCAPSQAKELVVPVIIPPLHEKAAPKKVGAALAQAQDALKSGRFRDADRLFRMALELDRDAYLAQEGLANVAKARGMIDETIRLLKEALPLEPANRVGTISQAIGDLYAQQQKWEEAAAMYQDAVNQGAPYVESRYALGLALYKLKRYRQAEVYLREVELHLKEASQDFRFQKEQLLHLLLSETYSNLNFPRYAIAEVHAGIAGHNDEVTKTAWKIEGHYDVPIRRVNIKVAGLYDTNVLAPYNTVVNLNGQPAPGGPSLLTEADLVLQSSYSRRWSYGGQYALSVNTHTSTTLAPLDTLTNAPTVWVAWWNLKNTEFKLFFDYSAVSINRNSYHLALQTFGPQLSWRLFWDKRHEISVLYPFHRNYFPSDPAQNPDNQQSGLEHQAQLKLSFAGPTPAIQPYLLYSFDGNLADGKNFYASINTVEAGFSLWTGGITRMTIGGAYSHVDFPNVTGRRADQVARLHAALYLPLSNRLSALIDSNFNNSSSYHRLLVTSGLTYALPF